ncbi:MAG: chemotaxis protein CheW [Myxococcota bacterium]
MNGLHVVFRVADAEYVLAAEQVLHLEAFEAVTRVPGTPYYVAGVMQTRGQLVPVVDLRRRFHMPEARPTLDSRVIVVQVAQRVIGLLVDRAREVVRLSESSFRTPPELVAARANGFIKAVAEMGPEKRMAMLIDLLRVVGEVKSDDERDAEQAS